MKRIEAFERLRDDGKKKTERLSLPRARFLLSLPFSRTTCTTRARAQYRRSPYLLVCSSSSSMPGAQEAEIEKR
mgnify:CR=1 FL=1